MGFIILGLVLLVVAGHAYRSKRRKQKNKNMQPAKAPDTVEESSSVNVRLSAIDKIISEAMKCSPENKLTYWTYGPVSTLAKALDKSPEIQHRIQLMGIGSTNIKMDSDAWERVKSFSGLKVYMDDYGFRSLYQYGDTSRIRAFEKKLLNNPVLGPAWKKYPLDYEKGDKRYHLKAGDYPLHLYTSKQIIRDAVFTKKDGNKRFVSSSNRYLSSTGIRNGLFSEIESSWGNFSATDGTQGKKIIIDTDIGLNGQQSDKDDQQALIMMRGLLSKYNVVAFIGTSPKGASGEKALHELFDLIQLSHLKDRCYQGERSQYKLDLPDRPAVKLKDIGSYDINWAYSGEHIMSWPQTSNITNVKLEKHKYTLDHTKKSSWPSKQLKSDNSVIVNSTCWLFVMYKGRLTALPFEYHRPGQAKKVAGWGDIEKQASGKMPGAREYVRAGDEAYMCIAGLSRGGNENVKERSQFVKVKLL